MKSLLQRAASICLLILCGFVLLCQLVSFGGAGDTAFVPKMDGWLSGRFCEVRCEYGTLNFQIHTGLPYTGWDKCDWGATCSVGTTDIWDYIVFAVTRTNYHYTSRRYGDYDTVYWQVQVPALVVFAMFSVWPTVCLWRWLRRRQRRGVRGFEVLPIGQRPADAGSSPPEPLQQNN